MPNNLFCIEIFLCLKGSSQEHLHSCSNTLTACLWVSKLPNHVWFYCILISLDQIISKLLFHFLVFPYAFWVQQTAALICLLLYLTLHISSGKRIESGPQLLRLQVNRSYQHYSTSGLLPNYSILNIFVGVDIFIQLINCWINRMRRIATVIMKVVFSHILFGLTSYTSAANILLLLVCHLDCNISLSICQPHWW